MLRRAGSAVAEERGSAHANVNSDVEHGRGLRQQHSEDEERARGSASDEEGTGEQQAQSDLARRQAELGVHLSDEYHFHHAKRSGAERGGVIEQPIYHANPDSQRLGK